MQPEFRLVMRHISKSFGGVKALQDVSLQVAPGEIHALLGENGAGKSTLMKILAGAYRKDAGEILLNGQVVNITTPKSAIDLGIAVIYQESMLVPDLSVAENIFIDRLTDRKKLIDWKLLKKKASEQLERIGFGTISPMEIVSNLSVAHQQVVEICKCITRNSQILVLDEPTAVLTHVEIEHLFQLLKQLRDEGVSIIYISHRLEEIMQLADRRTILKDGMLVDCMAMKDVTSKEQLVSKMIGRELSNMFPPRNATIGDVILEVKGLCAGTKVREVSFSVRSGEVVGFSGLVGSGRTETMRAIFGADRIDSGQVLYFGQEVRFKNPKDAISQGFGLLPEDRKKQGLILPESIRINTTLTVLEKMSRFGIVRHKNERTFARDLLDSIFTKYGSVDHPANSLSGGNQQKVSLAKWLAAECKCIVFDEPTRGVDVGAKVEIYKIINELAENGVGVVIISSEMTEIIGTCDRAIVMRHGRVMGEVKKADLCEENLIELVMGVA